MILRDIDKKEIWSNDDLIAYFGLYLNPSDDRFKSNALIFKSEYNNEIYSLDTDIEPHLFFKYENVNEWLELCKRYDCKSSENGTANLTAIVKEIAKVQRLDENIFLTELEKNPNKFGNVTEQNQNADLNEKHRAEKEAHQAEINRVENLMDGDIEKDEINDEVLENLINSQIQDESDNIPIEPEPIR